MYVVYQSTGSIALSLVHCTVCTKTSMPGDCPHLMMRSQYTVYQDAGGVMVVLPYFGGNLCEMLPSLFNCLTITVWV